MTDFFQLGFSFNPFNRWLCLQQNNQSNKMYGKKYDIDEIAPLNYTETKSKLSKADTKKKRNRSTTQNISIQKFRLNSIEVRQNTQHDKMKCNRLNTEPTENGQTTRQSFNVFHCLIFCLCTSCCRCSCELRVDCNNASVVLHAFKLSNNSIIIFQCMHVRIYRIQMYQNAFNNSIILMAHHECRTELTILNIT